MARQPSNPNAVRPPGPYNLIKNEIVTGDIVCVPTTDMLRSGGFFASNPAVETLQELGFAGLRGVTGNVRRVYERRGQYDLSAHCYWIDPTSLRQLVGGDARWQELEPLIQAAPRQHTHARER